MPTYHVPGGKTQFFTPSLTEDEPQPQPAVRENAVEHLPHLPHLPRDVSGDEYIPIEDDDDGVEVVHPSQPTITPERYEKKVHFEPEPVEEKRNDFVYLIILLAVIAFIFFARRV